MPQLRRFKLHDSGPTLWPEHKPPEEVYDLQRTTPDYTWQTTWQGRRVSEGGSTYKREWWADGRNRYDAADPRLYNQAVARFESWDTAAKDTATAAFSACVVGELWPDYRLAVRFVERERLELHELVGSSAGPGRIETLAARFRAERPDVGEVLRAVIIEDKSSGIGAVQTLRATAEPWLAGVVVPFDPKMGDKAQRGRLAAVWCGLDCVLFPRPDPTVPWLYAFEQDVFAAPNATFMDVPDALAQLILYTENLLAAGHAARRAQPAEGA